MEIRIAICDDNTDYDYNARLERFIEEYISKEKITGYEIVLCTSGLELIRKYDHGLFDFIFLDIDMPGLDGFETAEHIRKIDRKVSIVFVTNMVEQVYDSFKYGAKDYLRKPVQQEKIDELMDRLLEERDYNEKNSFYKINLKHGGSMVLYLPDVLYFESDGQYVRGTTVKDHYTFSENLNSVAAELESKGFIRIHRSRLINKKHVFQIFGNHIVLKNSEEFSVSRTYRDAVKSTLEGEW